MISGMITLICIYQCATDGRHINSAQIIFIWPYFTIFSVKEFTFYISYEIEFSVWFSSLFLLALLHTKKIIPARSLIFPFLGAMFFALLLINKVAPSYYL
jgi:hypothetical protein